MYIIVDFYKKLSRSFPFRQLQNIVRQGTSSGMTSPASCLWWLPSKSQKQDIPTSSELCCTFSNIWLSIRGWEASSLGALSALGEVTAASLCSFYRVHFSFSLPVPYYLNLFLFKFTMWLLSPNWAITDIPAILIGCLYFIHYMLFLVFIITMFWAIAGFYFANTKLLSTLASTTKFYNWSKCQVIEKY